jgi:hypothetical protein
MLIATDAFISTCKGMARLGGIPEMDFAVVPHPVGSLPPEELMERAKSAADQFVSIISEG